MREPPEVLASEIIAETRIFRVEHRELKFDNGTVVNYERLRGRKHGAVLVVPMRTASEVLMIREYAGGTHRYELALPKGLIDEGETIFEASNRELMEEIGYGARQLRHLDTLTVAPGYLDHQTHIVLAMDLYPSNLEGDEPEEIEVVPWSLTDLNGLLARDDVTEARSIAALFMAREVLANDQL